MPIIGTTIPQLVKDFFAINETAYKTKVTFFEKNEVQLSCLGAETGLAVHLDYINALFELGNYAKVLNIIDTCIEKSIVENIQFIDERDIYIELLLMKASSLFHCGKHEESQQITHELIRIDKKKPIYSYLIEKCLAAKDEEIIQKIRAISMAILILASGMIAVEIFIIDNFFQSIKIPYERGRNLLFSIGIFLLFGSELFYRVKHKSLLKENLNKK